MRKNYCVALMILSLGFCVALASPAWATKITNLTTGTVLFEDDFEGGSVCTGSYKTDLGDYDPVADTSSYTIEEQYAYGLQVCTGSCDAMSGAFEGSNYLRMVRSGDSAKTTYANLISPQSTAGDVIRLESMAALSDLSGGVDSPTGAGFFGLQNGTSLGVYFSVWDGVAKNYIAGSPLGYYGIYYDENNQYTTNTSASLLGFSEDTWHMVAIDYAMGATTYSLTIDDVTVTDIPANAALSSMNRVRIMAGTPNDQEAIYLDHVAVPEPGTIAMLIAGALAGVCFFRRRK